METLKEMVAEFATCYAAPLPVEIADALASGDETALRAAGRMIFEDFGPCDHSVGICLCDIARLAGMDDEGEIEAYDDEGDDY